MVLRFLRWRRHATPGGDATPRHVLVEYNTRDARDRFSLLLRRVRSGEQILICRAGDPVAKLVAYDGDGREPRRPGVIRAELVVTGVRRLAPRR
ncbi:MAG: type II toxin-antitoxin system prevent-host-death family antitoxin [Thermoleophilia bacterium]|nr:type II toxin-antitoxin system prevent-host-death family antitoxin [Thermoleophilia bacterium]